MEEGRQRAGCDVLAEEEPFSIGLAYFEQAGHVWVVDAPGTGQVVAEVIGRRDSGLGDAFEHGVPAGGEVPDQPDGADRSGPEPTAQAVAGDVFECHVQESARIVVAPAGVIHSKGRTGVLWTGANGTVAVGIHSKV
nr:hypothetical protein [Kribbella sp. VKM Ac-2568]